MIPDSVMHSSLHKRWLVGQKEMFSPLAIRTTVMDAYVDRSWYGKRGLYAVAAFLACANDWTRLLLSWRRLLNEADANLDVFHMTDFMSRKRRPYNEWGEEKWKRLLRDLVRTINENVDYGCAGVLLPSGYQAMLELHKARTREGKPSLGTNPYAICADTCIGLAAKRFDTVGWNNRRIAYCFESGDQGLPEFQASVSRILASEKYRDENKIIAATAVPKREAPALQTSDILAYELTHGRADRGEMGETLSALAARIPIEPIYIDDNLMAEIVEKYTPEVARQITREYRHRIRRQKKRTRRK